MLLSNLVMYTTILAIPFFVEEVQGRGTRRRARCWRRCRCWWRCWRRSAGASRTAWGGGSRPLAGSLFMLAGGDGAAGRACSRTCRTGSWRRALALLGLGLGLSFGPASTAAIESSPRELAGAAAGTNSMMRYLGSIIGAGMLGAVLNSDAGARRRSVCSG